MNTHGPKAVLMWLVIVAVLFVIFENVGEKNTAANKATVPPSSATVSAISKEWAADWSQKNLDATLALYAPEPVFLPAIGPRWVGTEMIRKNFADLLAKYNPHIELHSLNSQVSGTLAYDSGTYEETILPIQPGTPIHAQGNYLFVFQLQKDGHWKILEQTWTSLEPVNL